MSIWTLLLSLDISVSPCPAGRRAVLSLSVVHIKHPQSNCSFTWKLGRIYMNVALWLREFSIFSPKWWFCFVEVLAKKRNFSVLNFSLHIWKPEISFMFCEIEEIGYLEMKLVVLQAIWDLKVLNPFINKPWFRLECLGLIWKVIL